MDTLDFMGLLTFAILVNDSVWKAKGFIVTTY